MTIQTLLLHNRRHQVIGAIAKANAALSDAARDQKYTAMMEGPYRFFRGTSHLFWRDLYNDWRFSLYGGTVGTQTWIQGDAHVYNFGAFANHGGEAIYGLDDFDDALISDYQYDLWRLAISMVLDTREQGHLDEKSIRKGVKALAKGYLKTARRYSPSDLDQEVHYTVNTAPKPLAGFLGKVARKQGRAKLLSKWTHLNGQGQRRFDPEHPKLKRLEGRAKQRFMKAFDTYRESLRLPDEADRAPTFFKVKDVARRLKAGTGSLGTPRYYVLIEGEGTGEHDDIILDVKRQGGPAALTAMNDEERTAYDDAFEHEGVRHAQAFQALAEHPDRYLGWLELDDGAYSVRERSPYKKDFPSEQLTDRKTYVKMARLWGEILATEHKRASRTLNPDSPFQFERTLDDQAGEDNRGFKRLVLEVALHYAACIEQDYRHFAAWVRAGG